jgi:hypothetical protein
MDWDWRRTEAGLGAEKLDSGLSQEQSKVMIGLAHRVQVSWGWDLARVRRWRLDGGRPRGFPVES